MICWMGQQEETQLLTDHDEISHPPGAVLESDVPYVVSLLEKGTMFMVGKVMSGDKDVSHAHGVLFKAHDKVQQSHHLIFARCRNGDY
jgi:hypothetical protein